MNYNNNLLLECVNYYLESDFIDAKLSKIMSDGLLLIDVEKDINSIVQQKTVIVEKEEHISFLRMKKIRTIRG
jgi:hypothetical protein